MQITLRTLAALLVLTVIAAAQEPAAKTPAKSSATTDETGRGQRRNF
ncbi:MAG TPA: hypothetical protein VE994_04040 [Terriglobales bacterium]|nr:hypothetical protein [Terriglobales bacterium]